MRPQHVVFTCGLKNTVKASFLTVKTLRIWCRGQVWRCLTDSPGCLRNDTLCSTNSNTGAAPALVVQMPGLALAWPAQAGRLPRGPEMAAVCTDWAVKPHQEEIWNSDVSVKTNRKQDAATMQIHKVVQILVSVTTQRVQYERREKAFCCTLMKTFVSQT